MGDNTKESAEAQAAAEVTGDQGEDNGQTVEVQPANTRPRREIRVPTRYGLAYSHAAEAIYPDEPGSYREAMASPEKEKWQAAMQDELNSLNDNSTWTLVDRPKDRKVITGRWVYKIKTDEKGNIDIFKARYVAKGFMQVPGLDFHETYAPTCKPETMRTLFALAAQWGLELHQMDIKTAYLNSPLTETVYMEQPEGFTEGNDKVCLLQRSVYGLKQAGRDWYQTLSSFLEETGFIRSKNDFCLFTSSVGDELCYVLLWVDDIIIGCKSKGRINKLRDDFNQRFRLDDRGPLAWFLGMIIKQQSGAVTVSQTQYIDECLRRYGLDDCKPVSSPADVNSSFSKADCPEGGSTEAAEMKGCDYRGIVGCLLYIAKQSRPDILATVSRLSR